MTSYLFDYLKQMLESFFNVKTHQGKKYIWLTAGRMLHPVSSRHFHTASSMTGKSHVLSNPYCVSVAQKCCQSVCGTCWPQLSSPASSCYCWHSGTSERPYSNTPAVIPQGFTCNKSMDLILRGICKNHYLYLFKSSCKENSNLDLG